jgi:hypothetical protein
MRKLLFGLMTMAIVGSAACAGEAKVTWQEPDKYTDIREGNELRDSFREKLLQDFESIFADMAQQLPDGYLLEVTVTDLDLAGEVNGMHGASWENIRVVKSIYWPRMSFSYTLKNPARELLVAGQEELKDLGFMSSAGLSGKTRFGYEERMLKNWFKKQQREKKFPPKDPPAVKTSKWKPGMATGVP